jgi:hypothetical protein
MFEMERGRTQTAIYFGCGAFVAFPIQHHIDVFVHIGLVWLVFQLAIRVTNKPIRDHLSRQNRAET